MYQFRTFAESTFDEYLRDMAPKEIPDLGRNESSNIRSKLDNEGLSIEDLKTIVRWVTMIYSIMKLVKILIY